MTVTTIVDDKIERPRRTRRRKAVGLPDLPVLPVRDTVLFPHMGTPLFVGRERSVRAVEAALAEDGALVVMAQRDHDVQEPGPDDLYDIGTEVTVSRVLRMPDGTTSILAQGRGRVKVLGYSQVEPYLRARIMPLFEVQDENTEIEALR
ncbi:MAG: LON peptidase substrate-binding domain-containing protein, partial [Anaerolineae bacterium]|nr:LON peptidase substrate-binding domain-containing protein [Anaerolineae bacterium]